MTDKLKKQLILNLPYLIFVYLFDKLCQGVRLAPGADASEKLLHIGQGFSAAFASLAPSFHLLDLCVGAAGAVLIRLAVYSKGKNAKKYRRGIEYGSARWGTPADIAPYMDKDFSQNVLLRQAGLFCQLFQRQVLIHHPQVFEPFRDRQFCVHQSTSLPTVFVFHYSTFPRAWKYAVFMCFSCVLDIREQPSFFGKLVLVRRHRTLKNE